MVFKSREVNERFYHILCHRTTLLNTNVPNCYITLEFITIRLLRSESAIRYGFPLHAPGTITVNSHGWKEDSMLVKRLAAYTHLSSTVSEI